MKKRNVLIGLGVAAVLAAGIGVYGYSASAQGGPGYGPGMMGGYGPGMMGGPGRMAGGGGGGPGQGNCPGFAQGDGDGYGPGYHMRGRGGGYGPGMMRGQGPGYDLRADAQANPAINLTIDDVKARMERWLAWRENPRLKVGEVKEKDADSITAEIVTKDNSLVERFIVNRHTGFMRRDQG